MNKRKLYTTITTSITTTIGAVILRLTTTNTTITRTTTTTTKQYYLICPRGIVEIHRTVLLILRIPLEKRITSVQFLRVQNYDCNFLLGLKQLTY